GSSSVRSAEKIPAEGRQQERQDWRAQARRSAARRISALGLPWRERPTNLEGAGPQLSDDQQRSHPCDESGQGSVSKLGHFLWREQVYAPRHRSEWLNKIGEAGVRRRAEFFYQQLDARVRDIVVEIMRP